MKNQPAHSQNRFVCQVASPTNVHIPATESKDKGVDRRGEVRGPANSPFHCNDYSSYKASCSGSYSILHVGSCVGDGTGHLNTRRMLSIAHPF